MHLQSVSSPFRRRGLYLLKMTIIFYWHTPTMQHKGGYHPFLDQEKRQQYLRWIHYLSYNIIILQINHMIIYATDLIACLKNWTLKLSCKYTDLFFYSTWTVLFAPGAFLFLVWIIYFSVKLLNRTDKA